jgi:predicted RNA binding protein YcfA (HicA-like mRNA interferase family)
VHRTQVRQWVSDGEEICAILETEGFLQVRQRGSHVVMQRQTPTGSITVPVPNHREVRIGTLQAIIRQSGVSKEKFVR